MRLVGGFQTLLHYFGLWLYRALLQAVMQCVFVIGKPLLMLQSVKRGVAINRHHPQLHECLVHFLGFGKLSLLTTLWTTICFTTIAQ